MQDISRVPKTEAGEFAENRFAGGIGSAFCDPLLDIQNAGCGKLGAIAIIDLHGPSRGVVGFCLAYRRGLWRGFFAPVHKHSMITPSIL